MSQATSIVDTSDREILVTRTLNAPRELVFDAWTDPDHLGHWWGPDGFTTTTHEIDVRPGGVWRFDMHGPDGRDYPNRIRYVDVAKPERLVYQHTGEADVEGVRFHVTVTFTDKGAQTDVSLRMVFETAADRDRVIEEYGALEGAKQTLARLDAHLAAMRS
jgi:uncharacterized protein YndB with AHSA1/START domain